MSLYWLKIRLVADISITQDDLPFAPQINPCSPFYGIAAHIRYSDDFADGIKLRAPVGQLEEGRFRHQSHRNVERIIQFVYVISVCSVATAPPIIHNQLLLPVKVHIPEEERRVLPQELIPRRYMVIQMQHLAILNLPVVHIIERAIREGFIVDAERTLLVLEV